MIHIQESLKSTFPNNIAGRMGKSETVSANRNWPDRCFINQDFGKLGAMKPGKK